MEAVRCVAKAKNRGKREQREQKEHFPPAQWHRTLLFENSIEILKRIYNI